MQEIKEVLISIITYDGLISALIGALIGAIFSWIIAGYTVKKQYAADEEQRRFERMPLLHFEMKLMYPDEFAFASLGVLDGQLLTSANPEGNTMYTALCVSTDASIAFNFRVVDVYTKPYGIMRKSDAFAPLQIQLTPNDEERILFIYLDEIHSNIDVVIRFEYEDVIGNTYIQDAFFQYLETEYDGHEHKILDKREVLQPQLKKRYRGKERKVESLEKVVSDKLDRDAKISVR